KNSVFDLELELNFLTFLERNIEVTGIENLPKLFLNCAENLILVKPRADCLTYFSQQLVLLGAALRVVHDYVVFQRQADLQGKSNQQPQVGRAEHPPLGMGKEDDAEIVLAGLQADRRQVANVFVDEQFLELLKPLARKCRERLRQLGDVSKGKEPAAPVGQFGDVLSRALVLQLVEKLG